ncbi:MAG: tetratricopeptide repeat protein [Synechococcales cyanobacterium CRU_2_2]|nr:tetratricopeptide repeat protein [Synechococcales cyanobacterium CRU_2_2]
MAQHLGHQGELTYLEMRLIARMQDNSMMAKIWEQAASWQGLDELDILLQQGGLAYQFNNWNEAEVHYQNALTLAQEKNDREKIAQAIGQLGSIERNRGNWDEAERLCRQSLQMCEELGDRQGIAWVTSDRGANELGRGNLEQAETLLHDAFTQTQQLGMTQLLAEIHWHFAQLYRTKNNPTLAQHHYQTTHQLYSQLGAAKDLEKIEQEWSETSP